MISSPSLRSASPPQGETPGTDAASTILSSAWEIPVDYKIKAGKLGLLAGSDLTIFDAYGALAFRVHGESRRGVRLLVDAAGAPLITIVNQEGEWQGFKGNSLEAKDLIFTAKKLSDSAFKSEIEVNLSDAKLGDPRPCFRLKGSPFQKSCTIYKEDSVVAQEKIGVFHPESGLGEPNKILVLCRQISCTSLGRSYIQDVNFDLPYFLEMIMP